jgi:uncharacterized membrane protein
MFNVNKFQLSSNPGRLFGIYLAFSIVLTALVLVFAVLMPGWKRRIARQEQRRQLEAKIENLRYITEEELDGSIALTSTKTNFDS